MSFFARLLRSLSTKPRRGGVSPSVSLGLERLEERWTPAVSIAGQGTDEVTITDGDTGKTANAILIIDDFATSTTYIKINGGAEQQLGAAGTLVTSLKIDMGKGNDNVSFSVRGENVARSGGDRLTTVKLGDGNDAAVVNLGGNANYNNAKMVVAIFGGAGQDKFTLQGNIYNSGLDFTTNDDSGNDKYNVELSTTNDQYDLAVNVLDFAGNDQYKSTVNAAYNSTNSITYLFDQSGNDLYDVTMGGGYNGGFTSTIDDDGGADVYDYAIASSAYSKQVHNVFDSGAGKNRLTAQQGNMAQGAGAVATYSFTGNDGNTVTLAGNAQLSAGASLTQTYIGADGGKDSVAIDDNSVIDGASQTVNVDTYKGDDKVTVKFDGLNTAGAIALGSDGGLTLNVDTGDDDDALYAAFNGPAYLTNASSSGIGRLFLQAKLGVGNDTARINIAKPSLALTGPDVELSFDVDGGAGNDKIDVDLGSFSAVNGAYRFALKGDVGADQITLGGKLTTPLTAQLFASVDLGVDTVKDVFKSTLLAGAPTLPADQSFTIANFVSGVDVTMLATGPLAPIWTTL